MRLIKVEQNVWINPQKVTTLIGTTLGDPRTRIVMGAASVEVAVRVSDVARLVNEAVNAELEARRQ